MSGEGEELRRLVERAQAGDRTALETLLARLRPRIFGYVLARLADRAAAEDVTQEVAMTIVSTLPRYVDQGSAVLAWTFGIAIRKVSEARRAQRRRHESPVAALPETRGFDGEPESTIVRLETTRQMTELLSALPHPQGEILRLRIAAGLTAEHTAAVLGMSAGAVRVAQHRALGRLRSMVGDQVLR